MTMKQHMLVHKLVTIADNKCFSEGMLLAGYMKFLSVKSDHCFIYLLFPEKWPIPGWPDGHLAESLVQGQLDLVRGHSVLTSWSFLPTSVADLLSRSGKFKN